MQPIYRLLNRRAKAKSRHSNQAAEHEIIINGGIRAGMPPFLYYFSYSTFLKAAIIFEGR
jgi:hypothetical protein